MNAKNFQEAHPPSDETRESRNMPINYADHVLVTANLRVTQDSTHILNCTHIAGQDC